METKRKIRVGAVNYLNTKPLIYRLDQLAPQAELVLDLPSRLADNLLAGWLDVALIPSIELFADPAYTIVSDACIACHGPVMSVKLFSRVDPSEIDTIVVPAREEGFQEVFLGEDRWYKIRIHSSVIPRLKYIAVYQVAPTSAITHIADVASIKPWPNSNKYVVNFTRPARKIGPLKLMPNGRVKAPQASRYTSLSRLETASNLDDAFSS